MWVIASHWLATSTNSIKMTLLTYMGLSSHELQFPDQGSYVSLQNVAFAFLIVFVQSLVTPFYFREVGVYHHGLIMDVVLFQIEME